MTSDMWGHDWVADVEAMSSKFGVREAVARMGDSSLAAFLQFRLDFLEEELREARQATRAEDVVDAMIDLCVVAIGTLVAFDVDSAEAWRRVMTANMAKEVGVKPGRPNLLGLPDLIKPEGWIAPTHADNVGMIDRLFNQRKED